MLFWTRWLNTSVRGGRNRPLQKRAPRRMLVERLEDRTLLSATLLSDALDYAPGSTATLTATGFTAGETVEFRITSDVSGPGQGPWQVTDGSSADGDGAANGSVITTWLVDPDGAYLEATLTATATGLSSGELATTIDIIGNKE